MRLSILFWNFIVIFPRFHVWQCWPSISNLNLSKVFSVCCHRSLRFRLPWLEATQEKKYVQVEPEFLSILLSLCASLFESRLFLMRSSTAPTSATPISATLARALVAKSSWPDKEEFLDVIYWARQVSRSCQLVNWGRHLCDENFFLKI